MRKVLSVIISISGFLFVLCVLVARADTGKSARSTFGDGLGDRDIEWPQRKILSGWLADSQGQRLAHLLEVSREMSEYLPRSLGFA